MITQVRAIALRSRETIVTDFLGAAALVVTLLGSLYLPGLM